MDDPASFGRMLRECRKTNDLTQEQLAEQVHCSIETIKKIESGKLRPSKHLAELLATHLTLPPADRETFITAARADVHGRPRLAPSNQPTSSTPAIQGIPASGAVPAVLPTGTVTFLFTDVAGSTRLWEQHPEAMRNAFARHDAILRHAIATYNGVVVKTTGDGCHAAFVRSPDALSAALAAQRVLSTEAWGVTGPLRVRMALHTGVAEERDGDYYGPPLNRSARLLAAGHGGQILLSRATQEIVCDYLSADMELRDLGTHRLKDLIRPEHVFQLVAPGVATDFPALRTLDAYSNNLPSQPTPLIGRATEITAVRDRLRQAHVRLLTLTGPGGVGKTRLALQVAAELLDDFADGVYFVNLAPVREPALVGPAIAHTLKVTETSSRPQLEDLKLFLRDKQILLVLDNFEQVVDAAPLLAELLASAPKLTMLVTSRAVLHLSGEYEFVVPSLALPARGQLPILEQLTQYEAVRLFIARAQAVKVDFAVTNETAPAVAEICHRLDGLPLAIELAAARIKLFSPAALLKRLEQRLPLLTGGARDLPARQQTLRNTIAWSYDLLDADAQLLFAHLGVFVGGCTLEAAEAVCKANGDLPIDIIDGIAGLVNQSMLRQEEDPMGEPRFLMLETIREYALERLAGSGESEVLQQRHVAYYLALAEEVEPQLYGPGQEEELARLESEHDNFRAALAWSLEHDAAREGGLRLAGALRWFWYQRGYHREGLRWLEQVLERSGELPAIARARALLGAAAFQQNYRGDLPRAQVLAEEGLALYRTLGDPRSISYSLNQLGEIAWLQGDYAQATALYEESLRLSQQLGNPMYIMSARYGLAWIAMDQGDFARATPIFEESLAGARENGSKRDIAWVLRPVGILAQRQGELARARLLFEEALGLFLEVEDRYGQSSILNSLGEIAVTQRDFAQAIDRYEAGVALCRELEHKSQTAELLSKLGDVWCAQADSIRARASFAQSLVLYHELGDVHGIGADLIGLAEVMRVQGELKRATRLFGAATVLLDSGGAQRIALLVPLVHAEWKHNVAAVQSQLDEATFAAAWAEGQAMSLEKAITDALSASD